MQFTLFIAVVIALLLAAAVILFYTHRFFLEQSKSSIQNIQLSNSGITLLLEQQSTDTDTLQLSIPDNEINQSIYTHLSHWGIYEKAWVKSKHRKKEFTKCALLGTSIPSNNRLSLYLKNMFRPLVVVGNTKIEGKVMLPQKGVKTGSIKGHSYYGNKLIYGTVEESDSELPKFKYNYKNILSYYINDYVPKQENTIALPPGTTITNSFNKPTKGIASQQNIVLDNITITGNVIIRSANKIIVRNTTTLNDVILAAPTIEVEDGFVGNFQGIATTTIKIGKQCKLNYPSALIVLEEPITPNQEYDKLRNRIHINGGATVKGSICFIGRSKESDYNVNTYIGSGATVKGELYCDGNLELKGRVIGTVYTNQFIATEDATIFVNHLYNGTISSEALPEVFGGLLFENENKTTVQWLY
ncbi:polymer-forming cytoskeletal protein [Flavobacterium litorale]|uniref:Polymer-forming cytoskeletal protein n=1 Tax=Flavobacterium litorale TaxID=2856519 RepID=A0ABX8V622_9FLAO|nr:polymer-forming cytoskeletal protein [Flavobacterium litorale]QYJ68272.1 polymer-forming cytoskeletal protein [Flavobacterium litorale]